MSAPVIAIDAMGGDFGPHCIVPACLQSLAENPSLHLTLVGQSPVLEELLARQSGVDYARLRIVHAETVVGMDEKPAQVLRARADSSMRRALELVREGDAQACVSAGNTGALMALAMHELNTLPGIDRPAMVSAIPTRNGHCLLLDLGANVDCSAEQLFQFAVMGMVAAQVQGKPAPRVALLNIGSEEIKGNQQVKLAASLLKDAPDLNYVGFVEGDGLYRGEADVVVCDGFVGNILLKSSEGLAEMIAERLRTRLSAGLWARLVGALALPLLRSLEDDLTPARHNGASLLGLNGIVLKSHGATGSAGFKAAIARAVAQVREELPQRLHARLEHLLP